MGYLTDNEFANFDFAEAFINDLRIQGGVFEIALENVKILPSCTKNRDIRTMRTNDMIFELSDAKITSIICEGFKLYDPDGNLKKTVEDEEVPADKYTEIFELFRGSTVYSITKSDSDYQICIDTEDNTYDMNFTAAGDREKWERFINL